VKLLTKYGRINALSTVGIFLIASVALYFLIFQVLVVQLDHNLLRIRNRMEAYVNQRKDLPGPQLLDDLKVYYTPTGGIIPPPEYFESTHFYDSTLGKDHRFRKFFFPLKVKDQWYQVTLVKPLEGPHHVANIIGLTSIAVILIIGLTSLLINRLVLRKLWAPFYHTMAALSGFNLGDKSALPLAPTDIEEFSLMNNRLREATGKAAEDYRLLKEFTENASHEIQTPLAIIRSKLDLVIQDESLSEEQSEKLRSAYGAIKKISRLNQSLLLITKIENRQYAQTQPLALHEKLAEKLTQFQELWDNSRLHVDARIDQAVLEANPELVDILLNNLLSNATRHNNAGGQISICLEQGRMDIGNTGTNAPLDKERLFQRFYKETPNTDRVGLGLSIVHQICEVTGMAIEYRCSNGQHRFALRWT
jgi:signal transduction histidine kinase